MNEKSQSISNNGNEEIYPLLPAYINNDSSAYCIHELFEKQVVLTPHNTALKFNNKVLTYSQLNEAANKLAAFLFNEYSITPDTIIGIMLERSEKVIISTLAVLKTGAAYLPIDPSLPAERNAFICSDSEIKIVLTDNPLSDRTLFPSTVFIDLNSADIFASGGQNIKSAAGPNNLAYIIFTSGSTGNPKGVMIEHQSVINFINYNIREYNVTQNDIFLNLNSFFFDASVWELFVPLLTGASMVILEPGAQKYPEKIIAVCSLAKASLFFLTPALLQVFLSYLESNPVEINKLSSLRRLIVGGEALTPKLVNLFNKLLFKTLGTGITNIYGPTETTVWVTAIDCESDIALNIITIGKPISNTYIYILNNDNEPLQYGEAGELVVGGIQVGRGYLNRKQLDKEKFIVDPFNPGGTMYKTGDLARYLPDSNIEFLGRIDNQIKLNGFRIELNEIENAVLQNTHIKECVVLMKEINGNNDLVVYYTLTQKGLTNIDDELAIHLKKVLPEYMVPSFLLELPSFPINTNGKIDRKSLPLPSHRYHQRSSTFIPPATKTEKAIAALISESLNIDHISVDDNFIDLGIKSLLVTKLVIKINALFKTNIKLFVFFQSSTIRQLGIYIDNDHIEIKNQFVLLKPGKSYPLFLLPGAYGSPLDFLAFINNYKSDQPIYSITYPDDDELNAFENIQAFAKYLLTQIKLIQQTGPYNLVGYSFGGCLSFEIALQLQTEGEKVDLLCIVSADPPLKKRLIFSYKLSREFAFLQKPNFYLLKKYLKYRIPFLYKSLSNKYAATSADITRSNTSKLWESYSTDLTYKEDIILFYEDALELNGWDFQSLDVYATHAMALLWEKQVIGTVEKHKLICKHDAFFTEPLVKNIINAIEKHFNIKS